MAGLVVGMVVDVGSGKGVLVGVAVSVGIGVMVIGVTLGTSQAVGVRSRTAWGGLLRLLLFATLGVRRPLIGLARRGNGLDLIGLGVHAGASLIRCC